MIRYLDERPSAVHFESSKCFCFQKIVFFFSYTLKICLISKFIIVKYYKIVCLYRCKQLSKHPEPQTNAEYKA